MIIARNKSSSSYYLQLMYIFTINYMQMHINE